jgi:cytochrome b561
MRTAIARTDRYHKGMIWFHWTIAVLVIVNLFIGLFHDALLHGVAGAMPLHKSIGLLVLVLTVGLIGWRLTHRPPPLPAEMKGWEKNAAHIMHWALYALMLIMPLTGWMMVSNARRPHPIEWFNLFQVPFLPVTRGVAGAADQTHAILGYLMAGLVVLHIAAALRHHFILRDPVLRRMWPWHGVDSTE